MGPAAIAALGAGLNVGQNILNNIWTDQRNRRDKRFTEDMYARQRQDALDDWNNYMSPAAQMKHLKEANLNPNLVYGQGTQASPIRSVSAPDYNPQPLRLDMASGVTDALNSGVSLAMDLKMKNAQMDMMQEQKKVMAQQAVLAAAKTATEMENTETKVFDNTMRRKLEATIYSQAIANLDETRARTDKLFTEDIILMDDVERKRAMFAKDMQQAGETILTMRANRAKTAAERSQIEEQLKIIKTDQKLKRIELEAARLGVNKGSAAWFTILARALAVSKNRKAGIENVK